MRVRVQLWFLGMYFSLPEVNRFRLTLEADGLHPKKLAVLAASVCFLCCEKAL